MPYFDLVLRSCHGCHWRMAYLHGSSIFGVGIHHMPINFPISAFSLLLIHSSNFHLPSLPHPSPFHHPPAFSLLSKKPILPFLYPSNSPWIAPLFWPHLIPPNPSKLIGHPLPLHSHPPPQGTWPIPPFMASIPFIGIGGCGKPTKVYFWINYHIFPQNIYPVPLLMDCTVEGPKKYRQYGNNTIDGTCYKKMIPTSMIN